jgi:DNA-binding NarL/FixJ family response regulator
MRVAIADDAMLVREGVARLLSDAGFDITGTAADAEALLKIVVSDRPDVVIIDIKMPPTHTNEGLVAAESIRRSYPEIGVLVLSQYLDARWATRLLEQHSERVGYLLKERVSDIAVLADALERIRVGESVIDPTIVSRLVKRRAHAGSMLKLTNREREILALIAQGHSNRGICAKLFLSPKTVETHIRRIFLKLGLQEGADYHRRVLAVLAFLRAS